eukprot:Transcript_17408.p2 GENE.Transcript_17408~~Transcript_17408.p2  ORF type:complete len:174 (-),score=15.23 Transcript_17408:400-921(-)
MLALCLAVWGALCDNYDASQCAQMNDGGCNCVWVESRQSCTKGDVCGGVGITSVPDDGDPCTINGDCRLETDQYCGYNCVGGMCDPAGPMWCEGAPAQRLECIAADGSTVGEGETYTAPDGCNTCTCGEMGPMCTERACIGCPDGCVPARRARNLLFASVPHGSSCGQGCEPA